MSELVLNIGEDSSSKQIGKSKRGWILIPNLLVCSPWNDVGYVGLILHSMQMGESFGLPSKKILTR